MTMKKIILIPAIFIGSTLLYAEESAPTTYESIRIDQNVYLTDANVEITGTGKSFWAWEYSNGYFEYAAENGTMNVAGDIELGNTWSPFYNNSLSFGIYGSGNTVNVASGKRVYVTALGGSNNTANTFDFTVQSDNKDAVNTLNADRIDINAGRNYNDAEIGSITEGTLTFAGNTKLQSVANQNTGDTERYSADIFMNNGTVNGGTSKLIVKNSNNVLNIDDLIVNSESASNYTHTPKAIIDISGTGNEINVRWLNLNLNGANASTVF